MKNQKREEHTILENKNKRKQQIWEIKKQNKNENNERNFSILKKKKKPWNFIWKNNNKNENNYFSYFFPFFWISAYNFSICCNFRAF